MGLVPAFMAVVSESIWPWMELAGRLFWAVGAGSAVGSALGFSLQEVNQNEPINRALTQKMTQA